jgi:polar amino acid transport system ATP-binding protein
MTMSFSLPLVKMQALHKSYADGAIQVLKGIDIEMKPGERVVVIGPSGGGKSTLLRVMMGLEKIDRGSVTFRRKAIHFREQ